jgi:hypothetical protein
LQLDETFFLSFLLKISKLLATKNEEQILTFSPRALITVRPETEVLAADILPEAEMKESSRPKVRW